MSHKIWAEVDAYIDNKLLGTDRVLDEALAANIAGGLPSYDVSPAQGKLLEILARMCGARRILEVGTLGGYSTICLARALPDDGRLVSLEYLAAHAKIAESNIARAGLQEKVEIRVGAAGDSLPELQGEGYGPFDLVFIDADKSGNANYLDWALKLSRPGTVIICDNVIRDGEVADSKSRNADVQGARDAFDFFASTSGLTATAIQTVGAKGYDGFAIAIVD